MDTITIKSKLYDYTVEFVDDFSTVVAGFGKNVTYVIDQNVYHLYADQFKGIAPRYIYFMNPTENHKNMDTVMDIILFWKSLGVRKDWKVVCFGGGITQDVTTIASNLFLRNIDWYFFPTTLLAMCDSCIGGKCGINLDQYKNQIGVFYPPKKIFIDTHFLKTLSHADYVNGWGEILKFSLTLDWDFYKEIKAEKQFIPCVNIEHYIYKGLFVKKTIIEEDEFESDLRRVLNYGHTFGHALEAYTNNRIPHGTAVLWGMNVANYLSWQEGLLPEEIYRDVKKLIEKEFIKEEIIVDDPHTLFEMLKTDKKVRGNSLSFALLTGAGHLEVHPLALDHVLEERFHHYLMETHHAYNCD